MSLSPMKNRINFNSSSTAPLLRSNSMISSHTIHLLHLTTLDHHSIILGLNIKPNAPSSYQNQWPCPNMESSPWKTTRGNSTKAILSLQIQSLDPGKQLSYHYQTTSRTSKNLSNPAISFLNGTMQSPSSNKSKTSKPSTSSHVASHSLEVQILNTSPTIIS